MIEIQALVKQFAGTPRPAVDHLSLMIPEGEVCVLIGPSGCGKTTTMRIINRISGVLVVLFGLFAGPLKVSVWAPV